MNYTSLIVDNIKKYEWKTFSNNCIHLSFEEILENFYFNGYDGRGLLDHSFSTEHEKKALDEFRSNKKHNNMSIKSNLVQLYQKTVKHTIKNS